MSSSHLHTCSVLMKLPQGRIGKSHHVDLNHHQLSTNLADYPQQSLIRHPGLKAKEECLVLSFTHILCCLERLVVLCTCPSVTLFTVAAGGSDLGSSAVCGPAGALCC